MEENIRAYVEELFESAPSTQKAYEMKVELAQNLIEKYAALIAEGKTPEDAYNLTVMSIGDVRELFASLVDTDVNERELQAGRMRTAMLTSVAVMLYILSPIPVIIFGNTFSVILLLLIVACATGVIVFAQMIKPKPYANQDNVVSEFKDWQMRSKNRKQMKRAISTALWSLILVVYFLISFGTMKWYITWVIFPLGVAIEGIVRAFLSMYSEK